MYRVRLECPQDSTNRSRPSQPGSAGSCRRMLLVEQVGGGGQAHRRARVAVAGLLHRVHGQDPDQVDGPLVGSRPVQAASVGCSRWDQGSSPGPRRPRAGRAREFDHVHDPILSFALLPGPPEAGAPPVVGSRSRRYAPCHGDQPRLRSPRGHRGPAGRPPGAGSSSAIVAAIALRHRRARRGRAAERERRRSQRGAVPHRAAAGPAPGAAAGRAGAAGGPAGARAAGATWCFAFAWGAGVPRCSPR